jgi:hypothetical protein
MANIGRAHTPTRTAVTIADGVRAIKVDAPSPLPPSLDLLLSRLLVTGKRPYFARGTRRDCTDEQHDWAPWLDGIYAGLALRLNRCVWCGTVEVRDQSLDLLPGLAAGRGGPRQRDELLGWYAGSRPDGRVYL